jgi:hypothetical protein
VPQLTAAALGGKLIRLVSAKATSRAAPRVVALHHVFEHRHEIVLEIAVLRRAITAAPTIGIGGPVGGFLGRRRHELRPHRVRDVLGEQYIDRLQILNAQMPAKSGVDPHELIGPARTPQRDRGTLVENPANG